MGFQILLSGESSPTNGQIAIAPLAIPDLPGDYNLSGTVDLADYTLWRDQLGAQVASTAGADGNANGVVDRGDYLLWKKQFGKTLDPQAFGDTNVESQEHDDGDHEISGTIRHGGGIAVAKASYTSQMSYLHGLDLAIGEYETRADRLNLASRLSNESAEALIASEAPFFYWLEPDREPEVPSLETSSINPQHQDEIDRFFAALDRDERDLFEIIL